MIKRPNLINPSSWTPFRSIPLPSTFEPIAVQAHNIQPDIQVPIEIIQTRPITRREIVQRNSFYLNLFCILIFLGIVYFMYSLYLERKIFSDYLHFIQNEQDNYPGFH
jgi:hypothetical protein